MRQWLMNVSLLQGWLPATLFAITAALMVILLIGAIATIRKAGLKPVLMPLVVAAVAGAVGFVITWLLSAWNLARTCSCGRAPVARPWDSPSRIWLCGGVQVVHWP